MSRLELLWLITNHEKIQKILWRSSDWAADHVGMSRQPLYHHLLKFWTLETIWFFVCTCGCLLPFRIALTLSDTHSSAINKSGFCQSNWFAIHIWLKWNPDHGIHVWDLIERCHDLLLVMWPKILSYLCYKIGYVLCWVIEICCLQREGLKSVTPLCQRKFICKHTFRNAWEFHVPVDT
jgi:hypothetical protein